MKSNVAVSFELDDPEVCAEQLIAGLGKLGEETGDHALGILYCDADLDGATLTAILKQKLGFDVVGMTTLAALGPGGYNELSAVLTVLASEDVSFAVAATGTLGKESAAAEIAQSYENIKGVIGVPELIFLFAPCGMPFAGDTYPDTLAEVAPGVPIIGGVASDDYDYERARVFLSGAEYRDAAVFAAASGAISPKFFLHHMTSRFAERKKEVTRSDGNKVYEVEGETFVEYLEGFGLRTDVDDVLLAFNSYPMMLTREGSDEVPLMRHIFELDRETGAGSFLGNVPEGTIANICLVNKDDVVSSCRISMEALAGEVRADGVERSLVFCITCCGRSMILGTESADEGNVMKALLPEGFSLAGAYCLGEFSPTLVKGGVASNRFHNCSIAFCAL
jgi:hypothetical protein